MTIQLPEGTAIEELAEAATHHRAPATDTPEGPSLNMAMTNREEEDTLEIAIVNTPVSDRCEVYNTYGELSNGTSHRIHTE